MWRHNDSLDPASMFYIFCSIFCHSEGHNLNVALASIHPVLLDAAEPYLCLYTDHCDFSSLC